VTFSETIDHVAQGVEAVGVVVLVAGLFWSFTQSALQWRRTGEAKQAYRQLRFSFGAVLLLGLEILVAADLIRTIAVAPTIENVLALGVIVLIRTFLSFSLEVEIEGRLPWRARPGSTPEPDGG
jgi:uncharacterized membrane protein